MLKMLKSCAKSMFFTLVFVTLSVGTVFGQEEVEAAAEGINTGPGWMIAIIGAGVLVILGLGGAMSAQQSDEQNQAE